MFSAHSTPRRSGRARTPPADRGGAEAGRWEGEGQGGAAGRRRGWLRPQELPLGTSRGRASGRPMGPAAVSEAGPPPPGTGAQRAGRYAGGSGCLFPSDLPPPGTGGCPVPGFPGAGTPSQLVRDSGWKPSPQRKSDGRHLSTGRPASPPLRTHGRSPCPELGPLRVLGQQAIPGASVSLRTGQVRGSSPEG